MDRGAHDGLHLGPAMDWGEKIGKCGKKKLGKSIVNMWGIPRLKHESTIEMYVEYRGKKIGLNIDMMIVKTKQTQLLC